MIIDYNYVIVISAFNLCCVLSNLMHDAEAVFVFSHVEMRSLAVVLLFSVVAAGPFSKAPSQQETNLANHLIGDYETQASKQCNTLTLAEWEYNTDLGNTDKEDALVVATVESAEFQKTEWETWFQNADWQNFEDESVKRQAMFLSKLGTAALETSKLEEYNKELNAMTGIYGSARVCPYGQRECNVETEGLRLEPDIESVMSHSRDYYELEYMWTAWHEASGAPIRSNYANYVKLSNEAAILNGFKDMGAMWRSEYETENFVEDVKRLWTEVQPLYQRLHAYTKRKLHAFYENDAMSAATDIPAFLLGNMWAQTWDNIYDILEPFPNATKVNINQNMIDQRYNVEKMFEVANEFYTSMGLESMEMSYGDLAVTEQPSGKDIVCHASAWDFCDSNDFRIKMCTNVDEEDLKTIHHELGHIQYFMQYKDKPITFRKGANPGFHEAVGDVISLSASTPQHYVEIGLLPEYEHTYENSINTLLRSALSKVAFLPFAMVIDSWRWEVFSGEVKEENWNKRWWELRKEYQMVDSPVLRTEDDFDPGAKYHVPGNSQYINYFIAHILQFQIHRALCIAAQQYDPEDPEKAPLHTCDIYRSTGAGVKLRDGLRLGGSVHWSQVLEQLTGESTLSGAALLEYYQPLYDYLGKLEEGSEPVDQTVPIVVGAILGALVVAALTTYFVKQYRDRKNNKTMDN